MSDLISRQEAINELIAMREHIDARMSVIGRTAYEMAIEALREPETRWIPIKSRPMTEEERNEWSEKIGYDIEYDDGIIYCSPLPDDGQQVLVCNKWGNVWIDVFTNDPDYGCGLEENEDLDGVTAWMPLPKPWEGEKEE